MAYEVEVSDEFRGWYEPLSEAEQLSIGRVIELLEEKGTVLAFPYSSGIQGSQLSHMRELRIQHEGRPYRVLYAFDPARTAFLLVGGDKTGNPSWYEISIPKRRGSTLSILKNSNAGCEPSRRRFQGRGKAWQPSGRT